jgi:hypothetical protein
MYECRYDERLKTKAEESTRLAYLKPFSPEDQVKKGKFGRCSVAQLSRSTKLIPRRQKVWSVDRVFLRVAPRAGLRRYIGPEALQVFLDDLESGGPPPSTPTPPPPAPPPPPPPRNFS